MSDRRRFLLDAAKMACGVGFSRAPCWIIILAPPSSPLGGISSAGWKMNFTLPRS